MTTEEKARAYDEALERARKIHDQILNNELIGFPDQIREIFPQLRESEDERIRKEMIGMINECTNWAHKKEYVKYLEKQKESQELPLMNGDADLYFDTWRQEVPVPTFRQCFEEGMRYVQRLQKEQKPLTIESAYEKFVNPEILKEARTNKYIKAQLLWELMHNGIITEADYQYLTDDKRKPWTEEEYRIAYQKGFDMSEQLKQKEQKPAHTAKEMWKEMRLEVYAQASGNRHEPNYSDDSTKMFSLCDIDEIFEKIGNSTVEPQPAEWSEEDEKIFNNIIEKAKGGHWIEVNEITWLITRYHGDVTMTEAYKMGKKAGEASHWKPSEEQTAALNSLLCQGDFSYIGQAQTLQSLYIDLMKL